MRSSECLTCYGGRLSDYHVTRSPGFKHATEIRYTISLETVKPNILASIQFRVLTSSEV